MDCRKCGSVGGCCVRFTDTCVLPFVTVKFLFQQKHAKLGLMMNEAFTTSEGELFSTNKRTFDQHTPTGKTTGFFVSFGRPQLSHAQALVESCTIKVVPLFCISHNQEDTHTPVGVVLCQRRAPQPRAPAVSFCAVGSRSTQTRGQCRAQGSRSRL